MALRRIRTERGLRLVLENMITRAYYAGRIGALRARRLEERQRDVAELCKATIDEARQRGLLPEPEPATKPRKARP